MNRTATMLVLLVTVVASAVGSAADSPAPAVRNVPAGGPEALSLAGSWSFALDEEEKGKMEKWFAAPLTETVTLPGTTDAAHKGSRNTRTKETNHLTRLYSYTGTAWYRREVAIPENWKGRHVTLVLERTKVTEAWLDDAHLGRRDSLAAPQVYDLGTPTAGKHRLTILVDNKNLPKVAYGPGHQISEHTQTNWNGIVGRIELRATDKVWIEDVQLYPDVKNRRVKVRITLGNRAAAPASGCITVSGSFSPGGTAENSPGRQPWGTVRNLPASPEGAAESQPIRFLSPLAGLPLSIRSLTRGLRPWLLSVVPLGLIADDSRGDGVRPKERDRIVKDAKPVIVPFERAADGTVIEASYELGSDAPLWDEFTPALYRLSVGLEAKAGNESFADRRECSFGLREFATRGTQFTINGRATFLRGKHDACVFPLTGYAPMDEAGWERVFRIARSYGINHYRFHSWCPPEAAFAAADRVGIYLQPELMYFGGNLDWVGEYPLAEARRILAAYGNHPSFVMFTLGNELRGAMPTRARIVAELCRFDGRHLYAQATNYSDKVQESTKPLEGEPLRAEGDDYWITVHTKAGVAGHVRGSYGHAEWPLGHVQIGPPATTHDYAAAIAHVPVPVISHEVGQYQVFPNFKEIPKYTGVLRPWNFEVFRKRLADKGMLDRADDFVQASGKLTVLCYREEIEAALRTRGMGGFELLDLQDFPGQGTALVGILDAFMDSKGLVAPEAWCEFCGPTVPLALMDKYCWTTGERFAARIKVANYGPAALPGAVLAWTLAEASGKELHSGSLPAKEIPQGELIELGRIETPLASVAAPGKLQLTLRLGSTTIQNHYDLWVYPEKPKTTAPADVTVCRRLDEAIGALASGGRVLFLPEPGKLKESVEGFFAPDFWCYTFFRRASQMFKRPIAPGTLGLLIDPRHPALADFPTESHSNWQWFQIVMHSRSLILDKTPAQLRPIVQVIDNFDRNHKLGLIFEARVGEGRLLVCGADLPGLQDHPEASQLLASLLGYAGSDRFAPSVGLTPAQVRQILAE